MTVGMAAVAHRPSMEGVGVGVEGIVMVADRQITWGNLKIISSYAKRRAGLQHTGRGRAGWFVLYAADDITQAHEVVERFRELAKKDPELRPFAGASKKTRLKPPSGRLVSRVFARAYREARRLAKKEDDENRQFAVAPEPFQFEPDLILCGFDENHVPAIYRVVCGSARPEFPPGFTAIGSGEDVVLWTLKRHGTSPLEPIHKVLYACYAAKRHSDAFDGISPEFYAWVLVRGREQPVVVSPEVLGEMEKAFDAAEGAATPFPTKTRPRGTVNWKGLEAEIGKWYRNGKPRSASSPSGRGRRASQSRTVGKR